MFHLFSTWPFLPPTASPVIQITVLLSEMVVLSRSVILKHTITHSRTLWETLALWIKTSIHREKSLQLPQLIFSSYCSGFLCFRCSVWWVIYLPREKWWLDFFSVFSLCCRAASILIEMGAKWWETGVKLVFLFIWLKTQNTGAVVFLHCQALQLLCSWNNVINKTARPVK